MDPFDRDIRAQIYRLCVEQVRPIDALRLARAGGWREADVVASLHRLAGEVHPDGIIHLLVPARAFWDDVAFT